MNQSKSFFPSTPERWELSWHLYDIVLKAVNPDRSKRYKSISDFKIEWDKVI